MKDWKHKLAIHWAQEASLGPLPFWKRAFLASHLNSCAGCRSLSLDLVEMGYGYVGRQPLKRAEAELLHRRVMAAFVRQQKQAGTQPVAEAAPAAKAPLFAALMPAPAQGPKDPMRALFMVSLGAAALAVACIVALSLPWRPSLPSVSASPSDSYEISEPQPTADPSAVPPLEWSRINRETNQN